MKQYFKFVFYNRSKLLIICQRTLSYDKMKKVVVGRSIKETNKENKSLFGNLLETRKERRKSVGNKSTSINASKDSLSSVNTDFSEERNGKVTLKSKLTSQFRPRFETRVVKGSDVGNFYNSKPKELPTHHEEDINVNHDKGFLDDRSASSTIADIKEPRTERIDFSLKTDNKKYATSAVLPPIILNNILRFPMINQHKNIVTSYSLKTFDNLCTFSRERYKTYPSVSKILNSTMSELSKILLKNWRQKMVLELGEEGFLKFYKAQLNAGVQFHSAVQSFLRGTPAGDLLLDGRGVDGCWKSLESVITNVDNVQVLEGPVCHSDLLYHGVTDCVAVYQGEAVIIEWKKSEKPKPTLEKTYDAPVQLSAYLGAMNYDKNYPIQVKGGLVVVAYSDGSPADVFHLSLPECNKYWFLWLQRVQSFWLQQYQGQSNAKKDQHST